MAVKSKLELDRLREEVDVAVTAILEDLGMGRTTGINIRHSETGLTMKVEILYTDEGDKSGVDYRQEEISAGLVKPNTILWRFFPGDGWYEARILKANRSRYVFEWVDGNPEGQYTAPFKGFRPTDPEA